MNYVYIGLAVLIVIAPFVYGYFKGNGSER